MRPGSTTPYHVRGAFKCTATATNPVLSLAQAKAQIRVDIDDDDTLIQRKVGQASAFVAEVFRRTLLNATYSLMLDEFPSDYAECEYWDPDGNIRPPRPPLSSVTKITYVTTASATATVATTVYGVDTHSEPGRIYLKDGQVWPDAISQPNAVKVTFVGGYGAAATTLPPNLTAAVELYLSHLYENREAVAITVGGNSIEVPLGFKDLMWSSRIIDL